MINDNEPEWILLRRLFYSTTRLLYQPLAPRGRLKYIDFQTGESRAEMPPAMENATRFVVVSDTHMRHRDITLPRGDVLIHCGDVFLAGGDLAPTGSVVWEACFKDFISWLEEHRDYFPLAIFTGGNHDMFFEEVGPEGIRKQLPAHVRYLCDSDISLAGGLRVYGTGYSPSGLSSNRAFQPASSAARRRVFDAIPASVDVLITHSPPHLHGGPFGYTAPPWDPTKTTFGCKDLLEAVQSRVRPRVHLFGHIHEAHGASRLGDTLYVAASTVGNHLVTAANPPIVFDLPS